MYLMSSRFRQGGRKGRGERAGKGGTEFFFFLSAFMGVMGYI